MTLTTIKVTEIPKNVENIEDLWKEYESMHFHHHVGSVSCLAYQWIHFSQGTTLDIIEVWFTKQGIDTLTGEMV